MVFTDPTKFEILNIQDSGGRHLEKSKSRHISATVRPISTKLGKVTHFDHLHPVL